jgi:hypothetical protein
MSRAIRCLIAVSIVASAFGRPAAGAEPRVCDGQYALCTGAPCVPEASDPDKAVCFCSVEEGKSMATEPCETLKPGVQPNGLRTVYSTFSLDGSIAGQPSMRCPAGTLWTQCMNKRCVVDPAHGDRALCVCDVIRSGAWVTTGASCDTATCKTFYWSGATPEQHDGGVALMTKAQGLAQDPTTWCAAR